MAPPGPFVATSARIAGTSPGIALSELAAQLDVGSLRGDALVRSICYDSRKVLDGSLFFALPGTRTDGHDHAAAAVAAGAIALVVERPLDLGVAQLVVPSVRAAIGPMSSVFYGRPSEKLAVVAVTGTNGKTTTCALVRHCLTSAGVAAGQIGSVGTHFLGRSIATSLTTPQAPDVQWTLRQMVRSGVSAVAMEASSHGLDQRRMDGVRVDVGVFTNLSREHLDYHGTMERYLEAKARLFEPSRCRAALVWVDNEWGRELARRVEIPVTTFGQNPAADVCFSVEERGLDGIAVEVRGPEGALRLTSPLVGRVNGANVVAAYLATRSLGVPSDAARAGLATAPAPPGRFELVDAGQPFLVVVDYAHTPDALAALIDTARRIATGRVTLVLGARGGRDKGKRPETGRVAASADRVLLTTDSPGEEPIADIIRALYRGAIEAATPSEVIVEPDRRAAIDRALDASEAGDVVLIVGRGHEQFQHIGSETIALDDREVARESLLARSDAPGSACI
ncbi:MAG: UDP-N-acetylmuramoyl-L-alanyl-D-glutamate--2,6-diaminopimelate ligase [Acidimicrobiales bacterium]